VGGAQALAVDAITATMPPMGTMPGAPEVPAAFVTVSTRNDCPDGMVIVLPVAPLISSTLIFCTTRSTARAETERASAPNIQMLLSNFIPSHPFYPTTIQFPL
jgi:hypothetical protein